MVPQKVGVEYEMLNVLTPLFFTILMHTPAKQSSVGLNQPRIHTERGGPEPVRTCLG